MILAEEVALLLIDDISGKAVVDSTRLELALAGSVLLELAQSGRVDVAARGEQVKAGRLVVRDPRPTGDPVLDEALRRIATTKPRTPETMLPLLQKGLRAEVFARLVKRGILRFEEKRALGIFSTRSWPSTGSGERRALRTALYEVLVTGRAATPHEAAMISMVHAVDAVPKVLGDVGVKGHELRRRAKAAGHGGLADTAVRRAIDAVNSAMLVVVAGAAAGAASSS